MAGTTDFVPFATGVGANVTSQADWIAEPTTSTGFESGVASSADCNKAWRQGTFQAAVLANFVAEKLGINVPDDGDLTNGIEILNDALVAVVNTNNAATATLAASVVTTATSANANLSLALISGDNIVGNSALWYNPATGNLNSGGAIRAGISAYSGISAGDLSAARTSAPTTGVLYLGNSGAGFLYFNGSGYTLNSYELTVSGVNIASDRNLKYNIVPISDSGAIIDAISGVRFQLRSNNEASAGVIAQDVEAVLPEAVSTSGGSADEHQDPFKTVNYNALVGVLIEEVKALRRRVADLEAR